MHGKRDFADVTESAILRWELILVVWVGPKCYIRVLLRPSLRESQFEKEVGS